MYVFIVKLSCQDVLIVYRNAEYGVCCNAMCMRFVIIKNNKKTDRDFCVFFKHLVGSFGEKLQKVKTHFQKVSKQTRDTHK